MGKIGIDEISGNEQTRCVMFLSKTRILPKIDYKYSDRRYLDDGKKVL